MAAVAALISGARRKVSVWPPVARAPLPPFPSITPTQPGPPQSGCWAAEPYTSVLPAEPPTTPDVRYTRGNFCIRIPGLTEGDNEKDRSLILTWEASKLSPAGLQLYTTHYRNVCGYTHGVLSRPQTLNYGLELDDLKRATRAQKAARISNCITAVSDGDPFAAAVPWLDALHAEGLIDACVLAWQADKWYPEQDICQLIVDGGAWCTARRIPMVIHWGGGYPGWAESCACWNDITAAQWGVHDRFTFQAFAAAHGLTGHYGQCDVEADVDQVQSWIRKIVVAFPPGMQFVAAEIDAQAQYDDPTHRLEIYGDMKGYLACCTDPRVSYLNGGRRPDGSVL